MKLKREHATNNSQTYFVTSETWQRRALFRAEPWARLFFQTLSHYRGEAYLLHGFVLMPDHFHLLISPLTSLEKAIQLVKGGFSFRAKKELARTQRFGNGVSPTIGFGIPKISTNICITFISIR